MSDFDTPPRHLQKWIINLMFKNKIIHKNVTNFKNYMHVPYNDITETLSDGGGGISHYTSMTIPVMLSIMLVAIYADDTSLRYKCVQASDLVDN